MARLIGPLRGIQIFRSNLSKKLISQYYTAAVALFFAIQICGFIATYLLFAAPRKFRGDFYAAMYDPNWWDGSGLIYGPIFVFQRWLVNAFPNIFTIEFFGFFSILLITFSLVIGLVVTTSSRAVFLTCLSAWCLNSFFYYSFSVAAVPELTELLLLMVVWWGLSIKRFSIAAIALTLAILTKLAPIILAPLLIIFFSWTGLFSALLTSISLFLLVSIGQKQSTATSISQFLETKSAEPQPTSEQFLGMSSALARVFGQEPTSNFLFVNRLALIVAISIYLFVLFISFKLSKVNQIMDHRVRVAYLFILYLGLLPILHLNAAHRHTFIFLAPVFVGFAFILSHDDNPERVSKFRKLLVVEFFLYSFIPLFTLDIFNFDDFLGIRLGEDLLTTLLYISEPIWINLLLVITLLLYGRTRFLSNSKK